MDERRMVNASLFAWYVCLVLMLLFFGRCSNGDVATSPDLVVSRDVVGSASGAGTVEEPVAVPTGAEEVGTVSECDEVGLERAGVRWQVDGRHQLLLFVPMSPAIGEPYVNVWTPEVNSTFLGKGPANEWFGVSLPHFGSWRIRLAAETIDHTGRVRQCDTHRFQVLAKPPPPPPPPTPPECEPVTRCDASLRLELGDEGNPGVRVLANWEVEDWCGVIVLRQDGEAVIGWAACSDGCEPDTGADSFRALDVDAVWSIDCVSN